MKIVIKTLQGKQLPLEVEETDTVSSYTYLRCRVVMIWLQIRQVKEKIQAEHQMQADLMKLIAYGKVMEDDNKNLKDYSIKEGDFLVVMISKVLSKHCSLNLLSIRLSPPQRNKKMLNKRNQQHHNNNNNNHQLNNNNFNHLSNNNNQLPNSNSNQLLNLLVLN